MSRKPHLVVAVLVAGAALVAAHRHSRIRSSIRPTRPCTRSPGSAGVWICQRHALKRGRELGARGYHLSGAQPGTSYQVQP